MLLSRGPSPASRTLATTEAAAPRGHLSVAGSAPSPSCLVLGLHGSNKAHGSYIMCSENLPFVPPRVDFQSSFCPSEADGEGVRSHESLQQGMHSGSPEPGGRGVCEQPSHSLSRRGLQCPLRGRAPALGGGQGLTQATSHAPRITTSTRAPTCFPRLPQRWLFSIQNTPNPKAPSFPSPLHPADEARIPGTRLGLTQASERLLYWKLF